MRMLMLRFRFHHHHLRILGAKCMDFGNCFVVILHGLVVMEPIFQYQLLCMDMYQQSMLRFYHHLCILDAKCMILWCFGRSVGEKWLFYCNIAWIGSDGTHISISTVVYGYVSTIDVEILVPSPSFVHIFNTNSTIILLHACGALLRKTV